MFTHEDAYELFIDYMNDAFKEIQYICIYLRWRELLNFLAFQKSYYTYNNAFHNNDRK
jgi:hypothetical protein